MPEEKGGFKIDSNYNPKNYIMPEVPESVKELRRRDNKQRRNALIAIIIFIIILTLAIVSNGLKNENTRYNYIKLISALDDKYSINAPTANIKELQFTANLVLAEKSFNRNSNIITFENINDFAVYELEIDLKDKNATSLSIPADDKGIYNVFIGTSEKGPWEYLGKKKGPALFSLSN